jgi:hypothetical protein
MQPGSTPNKGMFPHHDVSAEQGAVRQYCMVSNLAVVRHVGISHEEAISPDKRGSALVHRPVYGYALPQPGAISNLGTRWSGRIKGQLLRISSHDRKMADSYALAKKRGFLDDRMRLYGTPFSYRHPRLDDGVGPYGNVLPQMRMRIYDCRGVN